MACSVCTMIVLFVFFCHDVEHRTPLQCKRFTHNFTSQLEVVGIEANEHSPSELPCDTGRATWAALHAVRLNCSYNLRR